MLFTEEMHQDMHYGIALAAMKLTTLAHCSTTFVKWRRRFLATFSRMTSQQAAKGAISLQTRWSNSSDNYPKSKTCFLFAFIDVAAVTLTEPR